MGRFRRAALSSTLMPDAWRDAMTAAGVRQVQGNFSMDLYAAGKGKLHLVSRLDPDRVDIINAMGFTSGEAELTVRSIDAIPRGSRITLGGTIDVGRPVGITYAGTTLEIDIRPDEAGSFEGCDTLFTVTLEPEATALTDWLDYHARAQGATAALICVRSQASGDDVADKVERFVTDHPTLASVVWVALDIPLGHPDLPAETDRHMTPDGPGKSQLAPPVPDVWRSPVHDLTVLEVARVRFLRKARAVLFCQPSDMVVTTTGAASVFSATASGSGFVKFFGKRAYPFALDDDRHPRLADHNCISFDGSRAENIWCAAPAKMEPDTFWRQFRVSQVEPDAIASHFDYWRCMAVRFPGLKVSELVPKSSLVAEPDLIALVKTHFGTVAKAPPSASAATAKPLKNDRILIVTTMKNEGPFILEWLAYHRSIGVTDFLVYTNDCTDGTAEMFEVLQAKGLVEHRENPYRETGLKPQHAAHQVAQDSDIAKAADWVICMDVDEYINIHVGDGSLAALFDAVPDATLISLTWRLFGNADISDFEDAPVIEQFTQCAREDTRKPHQAWGFKTLFRNLDHYKKFGVHRPKGLKPEYLPEISWVNGSGIPMPDKMLRSGWRSSSRTIGYDLVSLNHYALRSAESFLVKRDRGRVNHVDRDQGLAYWFRMNHNMTEDRSISRQLPAFRSELANLMADPEIAACHAASVTAHQAKIAELHGRPEYQALFADITGVRLRTLSRMLHHFGNQVFLDGPDAVPPDFHLTQKP